MAATLLCQNFNRLNCLADNRRPLRHVPFSSCLSHNQLNHIVTVKRTNNDIVSLLVMMTNTTDLPFISMNSDKAEQNNVAPKESSHFRPRFCTINLNHMVTVKRTNNDIEQLLVIMTNTTDLSFVRLNGDRVFKGASRSCARDRSEWR